MTKTAIKQDFLKEQPKYSKEEHDRWKRLVESQMEVLPDRAFQPFMEGLEQLGILAGQIPKFEEVNKILSEKTGWTLVGVTGLVPNDMFFEQLAGRQFPVTCTLRSEEEFDYIEAPDIFHDMFGHVPLLINPIFAEYMESYGKAGLRVEGNELYQEYLARLYWYTVEFGLIETNDGLRIYGSGIVSSRSESIYALSQKPHMVKFDLERVMRTEKVTSQMQEIYFVVSSMDEFIEVTNHNFSQIYQNIRAMPEIPFGFIHKNIDTVVQKGTITV